MPLELGRVRVSTVFCMVEEKYEKLSVEDSSGWKVKIGHVNYC